MSTTIERSTTAPTGLEQFLPRVPSTPPLAPQRSRKQTDKPSSTPAPARTKKRTKLAAPQEQPMGETAESRRAKTLRMGQARMVNALRAVRLWGNLASRNYEWHDGEPERMRDTLIAQVTNEFSKFNKTSGRVARLEDMFNIEETKQ